MLKNTSVPPRISLPTLWRTLSTFLAAALYWYSYGLRVIPITPGTKITAVKWDPWLDALCPQKIKDYWTKHPDHELGFIVGEGIIVFDADGPESVFALQQLESRYSLSPILIVKTSKGEHHYFRRAIGTIAKPGSHCSEKHPNRLDIKTGRSLVVLPPSTGKSILINTSENCDGLSEATQEFIDEVYEHNGGRAQSKIKYEPARNIATVNGDIDKAVLKKLELLLDSISPDCGYDTWTRSGMAIFHETKGSDDGLVLYDCWSSNGKKYCGLHNIEAKWRSFSLDIEKPVTIGSLIMFAKDAGADVATILNYAAFEKCNTEVVYNVD